MQLIFSKSQPPKWTESIPISGKNNTSYVKKERVLTSPSSNNENREQYIHSVRNTMIGRIMGGNNCNTCRKT